MLTSVAALRHTDIKFPGAGLFVLVIIVVIVVILVRMYGGRGR